MGEARDIFVPLGDAAQLADVEGSRRQRRDGRPNTVGRVDGSAADKAAPPR
jgi:hypothetical protein